MWRSTTAQSNRLDATDVDCVVFHRYRAYLWMALGAEHLTLIDEHPKVATEIQGERAKVSVHKLEKLSREKHKHQIEVHEVSFDMWDKASRLGGHKETIVTPRHSTATA